MRLYKPNVHEEQESLRVMSQFLEILKFSHCNVDNVDIYFSVNVPAGVNHIRRCDFCYFLLIPVIFYAVSGKVNHRHICCNFPCV